MGECSLGISHISKGNRDANGQKPMNAALSMYYAAPIRSLPVKHLAIQAALRRIMMGDQCAPLVVYLTRNYGHCQELRMDMLQGRTRRASFVFVNNNRSPARIVLESNQTFSIRPQNVFNLSLSQLRHA